jgi:hypothetical protein
MILGGEDDKPYAVDELEKILAADDAELRDANFISLLFLIPDFSKALRRDIQEIGESYKAEIGSIAFDVCSRTEIVVCYRLIRDFEYPIGS